MSNVKVNISKDRKYFEIILSKIDATNNLQDTEYKFVLTVNQTEWLSDHVKLVSPWLNSANKKYQIVICKKAFVFRDMQVPKNAIIVFDRADMLWVCSSFAFTVKHDKDGKRQRRMIPKKHLKYMHVSCYDFQLQEWTDTVIGRGSLMFNIHDAIIAAGINHVEYNPELRHIPDEVYAKMMKDCIRRKKSDCGGRQWDNPYAMNHNLVHRGYSDESHWTGMVGSMIANNLRYSC